MPLRASPIFLLVFCWQWVTICTVSVTYPIVWLCSLLIHLGWFMLNQCVHMTVPCWVTSTLAMCDPRCPPGPTIHIRLVLSERYCFNVKVWVLLGPCKKGTEGPVISLVQPSGSTPRVWSSDSWANTTHCQSWQCRNEQCSKLQSLEPLGDPMTSCRTKTPMRH
jgi:hypothetical protein